MYLKKMESSYDMLLDIMETTMSLIKELREHKIETTNIKMQIAILSDMIKSFKRLQDDLIDIEKDLSKN